MLPSSFLFFSIGIHLFFTVVGDDVVCLICELRLALSHVNSIVSTNVKVDFNRYSCYAKHIDICDRFIETHATENNIALLQPDVRCSVVSGTYRKCYLWRTITQLSYSLCDAVFFYRFSLRLSFSVIDSHILVPCMYVKNIYSRKIIPITFFSSGDAVRCGTVFGRFSFIDADKFHKLIDSLARKAIINFHHFAD